MSPLPLICHKLETKNIVNRETQGKVSLPACVIRIDLSFYLNSCSQTKHFQVLVFLSGLKNSAHTYVFLNSIN